jgi:hypothetical protein
MHLIARPFVACDNLLQVVRQRRSIPCKFVDMKRLSKIFLKIFLDIVEKCGT